MAFLLKLFWLDSFLCTQICNWFVTFDDSILSQTDCVYLPVLPHLQTESKLTALISSCCRFITILMHQICFEDDNWLQMFTDLVPVFKATISGNKLIAYIHNNSCHNLPPPFSPVSPLCGCSTKATLIVILMQNCESHQGPDTCSLLKCFNLVHPKPPFLVQLIPYIGFKKPL